MTYVQSLLVLVELLLKTIDLVRHNAAPREQVLVLVVALEGVFGVGDSLRVELVWLEPEKGEQEGLGRGKTYARLDLELVTVGAHHKELILHDLELATTLEVGGLKESRVEVGDSNVR